MAKGISDDKIISKELVMPKKITRDRLSMIKFEHFYEFLFDSGFIQDVAYGTTQIKLQTRKSIDIPKAVRTTQKQHIIQLYKSLTVVEQHKGRQCRAWIITL